MFGLFKKTRWKIDGKAYDFFDMLFKQLPTEFHFLSKGLHNGLYRRFSVNHAIRAHHYTIGFDPSKSDRSMIKGMQFELENILIIQNGNEFSLNLTIYEGLWIGFEIERNVLDFTDFTFDLSKLHKGKSKFSRDSKMAKVVSGLSSTSLDLDNLSEFEVEGKYYYQIKDLEDGNYIAIDNRGQVFGLIHDPYRIQLINQSIRQFVADVNNGQFDFEKYLSGQKE